MNPKSKSKITFRQFVPVLVVLIALVCRAGATAASIVEVSYKHDGKLVAKTIYSGPAGGSSTKSSKYWELLDGAPMLGAEVTIKPDKPGGKVATLKGKIEVSITIRNQYNKGVAKTDQLKLIRDDGESEGWYLSKTELERVAALVGDRSDKRKKKPAAAAQQKDGGREKVLDARTLLEVGKAAGKWPRDLVLRVRADMSEVRHVDEEKHGDPIKKLQENWEFTAEHIYRVVGERVNNRFEERRVESRPFNSKNLCKDLLDGKALEIEASDIEASDIEGEPVLFAGTPYDVGERSIMVIRDFDTLMHLAESCLWAGYAETDSLAFTALYEKLAKQARAAFAAQPVPEK